MNKRGTRIGAAMPDLIVAALLTTTLIGTLTTFTARGSRLMIETRHHQFAIDELSNQLEYLLSLDEQSRLSALTDLTPSEQAAIELPGATLESETLDDSFGKRLVLKLNWNRGAEATPIKLVGWIQPIRQESTE